MWNLMNTGLFGIRESSPGDILVVSATRVGTLFGMLINFADTDSLLLGHGNKRFPESKVYFPGHRV